MSEIADPLLDMLGPAAGKAAFTITHGDLRKIRRALGEMPAVMHPSLDSVTDADSLVAYLNAQAETLRGIFEIVRERDARLVELESTVQGGRRLLALLLPQEK